MASALISCIVVLPFLIVALVFFFIWRRNNQQAQASRNWPSTLGTIGASSIQARPSHSSEGGTSTAYYPEVLYQYEVNGNRYMGQRITFGSQVGYGDSNRARAIVDRYVPGNQIRVYYNPNNPSDAVLEQSAGTSSRILFWVAILILVILCITIVPTVLVFSGMNAFFSSFPFMR